MMCRRLCKWSRPQYRSRIFVLAYGTGVSITSVLFVRHLSA